jgi:hypothetical protein
MRGRPGEYDRPDIDHLLERDHPRSRGPSDALQRHKDLISHRIEKLTSRVERAGFTPEEVEELKKKIQENAELEYQVIESRSIDSHHDERGRPKSAEDRMKNKDGMQERRQFERESMEKAREGRRAIEDRIREKERENSGRGDF